ncbi:hypothetical protein MKW92_040783 [Papaver armeniacum]|nr:hypothetical protein MKW92_040783 [Papaver armeniacum]
MEFLESSGVLKKAMKAGTTEFVVECLGTFPDLIWDKKEKILQMAVEERNHEVLNLLCNLSKDRKDDLVSRMDENNNHILHHVAKLPASVHLNLVLGAPLQMQREMQWFKAIENLLPEKYRLVRNKDGKTAMQIFTEAHKPLVVEAEKWLKGTSESCMLVNILIAAVTFAAAITVPGGNSSDSISENNGAPSAAQSIPGIPIFLSTKAFKLFAIADSLSLFFSVTSVLLFLSILTSRYAEIDFLRKLPTKLILGLLTLFVSISTLMVAFGAALYLTFGQNGPFWTVSVACFPVVALLYHFRLFMEMVYSTFWRRNIVGRHKHRSVKLKAD